VSWSAVYALGLLHIHSSSVHVISWTSLSSSMYKLITAWTFTYEWLYSMNPSLGILNVYVDVNVLDHLLANDYTQWSHHLVYSMSMLMLMFLIIYLRMTILDVYVQCPWLGICHGSTHSCFVVNVHFLFRFQWSMYSMSTFSVHDIWYMYWVGLLGSSFIDRLCWLYLDIYLRFTILNESITWYSMSTFSVHDLVHSSSMSMLMLRYLDIYLRFTILNESITYTQCLHSVSMTWFIHLSSSMSMLMLRYLDIYLLYSMSPSLGTQCLRSVSMTWFIHLSSSMSMLMLMYLDIYLRFTILNESITWYTPMSTFSVHDLVHLSSSMSM
jgi:hypothetical protein